MGALTRAGASLLALGCRGGAGDLRSDVDRYVELLADRSRPPAEVLDDCLELSDPDLAGDCAVAQAGRAAARPGAGDAEELCPSIPEGRWRDECWFRAAEGARRRGRAERAAELCRRAGDFAEDCAQHLWQSELRALVARHRGDGFAAAWPRARAIRDRWARWLGDGIDERFWARFYEDGFALGPLDLHRCDGLEAVAGPDEVARCREAAAAFYARELGPRLDAAGIDLCALERPTVAELARVLPAEPDPRLQRALDERRARQCGGVGR